MSIRSVLFSTVLFSVFASLPVHAQQRGEGPCAADAKKLCSSVKPGQGRVYRCMESHQAELSPACRERMEQAKAKLQELAQACKADAQKYCKGVRRGGGRILGCLKRHEAELEPACAAEFKRTSADPSVGR